MLSLLLPLLNACQSHPTPLRPSTNPDLAAIRAAYEQGVRAALADPGSHWNSGWRGNMWVNFRGGAEQGLCNQWQALVWRIVAPRARSLGWRAVGVAMDRHAPWTHYAVVVFQPATLREDELVNGRPPRAAWVLDPWITGTPEAYLFDDWSGGGTREVELENLDAQLGPSP